MNFAIVGSGSKANAYIFEGPEFSILIDNGYTLSELKRRLKALNFDIKKIKFIFLTHLHSDHFKGVEALAQELNIPVVTHKDMPVQEACKKGGVKLLDIEPQKNYTFDSLQFRAFLTSHDAPSSLGFYFTLGEEVFTLITDTGKISPEMKSLALRSDYLFLESNYSPRLLHSGPYPQFLKSRILSDQGHLSNLDAGFFMSQLAQERESKLKKIFLCHLSDKNNSPDMVEKEIQSLYQGDCPYFICPKNESLSRQTLLNKR